MFNIFVINDVLNLIVSFIPIDSWPYICRVNKDWYHAFLTNKKRLIKNFKFIIDEQQPDIDFVLKDQIYKFPAYNQFSNCIDINSWETDNSDDDYVKIIACFSLDKIHGSLEIIISEIELASLIFPNMHILETDDLISVWFNISSMKHVEKYIDIRKATKFYFKLILFDQDKTHVFYSQNKLKYYSYDVTNTQAEVFNLVMQIITS